MSYVGINIGALTVNDTIRLSGIINAVFISLILGWTPAGSGQAAPEHATPTAVVRETLDAVFHILDDQQLKGPGHLTQRRHLLENIIEPSKVISDQFGTEQIERTDGDPIVGRVVGEENGELLVLANPFSADDKTRVKTSAVKSRKPFGTSMMPAGLINSLNPEELQDLLAYLLSGGNEQDAMFRK